MSDLYIYGAGGHAKVVAATARLLGYSVQGFWEDAPEALWQPFGGSYIIPFAEVPHGANIFVAFGNNQSRLRAGRELLNQFSIPAIIHPSAQVAAEVKIGSGVYIGALSNIDPACIIGDFSIINNMANISHDTVIKDGCHICGNCAIAGNCLIHDLAFLGVGAAVIPKITIGQSSIVGAGSVVIRDVPDSVTVAGSPARVIKHRN